MKKKSTISYELKFDSVVAQAIILFQDHVKLVHEKNPKRYKKNPKSWIQSDDYAQVFEYLMKDNYWVRLWSCFLIQQLVHLIYNEPNPTETANSAGA